MAPAVPPGSGATFTAAKYDASVHDVAAKRYAPERAWGTEEIIETEPH